MNGAPARLRVSADAGAVISIRNWELSAVIQGVGPLEASVPEGLYVVTASYPGQPRARHVIQLKSGQTVSVALSGGEVEERRVEPGLSTAVGALSENLALLFGSSRKVLATLDLPHTTAEAARPGTSPLAVWVRFATLRTWETSATLQNIGVDTGIADGVPFLTVHAVKESPLILQIGYPGVPVTNVLIPSRLMNVSKVRVLLPGAAGSLEPTVELKADWGDLAAQFAMAGNVHAAKQALEAEIKEGQDAGYAFLSRLALRFRNLAAIAYVPYLVLRLFPTSRLEAFPSAFAGMGEQMADLLGFLPDAHVVAAELAAREGNHGKALEHLLRLPPGHLPVFTDGFSILISRLRSYADPIAERRPEAIDAAMAEKAAALLGDVLPWAPYTDFSSLTLTFTGSEVESPGREHLSDTELNSKGYKLMPLPSQAVSFEVVHAEEKEQIAERRKGLDLPDKEHGDVGLALSGGGIRSATFNLGILQGMSEKGLLPWVDYLSTVSGGGYIGTWLHGVIQRKGGGDPGKIGDFLARPDQKPHTEEDDPIAFLRKYSSYLAPSMGILSADFWVIMVIWFRNMFLNQLMLIPFLASFSLLAVSGGILRASIAADPVVRWYSGWIPTGAIVLSALIATIIAAMGARPITDEKTSAPGRPADGITGAVTSTALLLLASILIAHKSRAYVSGNGSEFWWMFAISAALIYILQAAGGYLGCFRARHPGNLLAALLSFALWPLLAGAVTAGLFYGATHWIASWEGAVAGTWHVIAWGPPLIMLAWMAGAGFQIGLMGADFPDYGREWFARVGAYMCIAALAWASLFALTIFGPEWFSALALHYNKTVGGLVLAWLGTTLSGVFSGGSSKTSGEQDQPGQSKVLELIVSIAPTIFVVGMMLLIGFGVHVGLRAVSHVQCTNCSGDSGDKGSTTGDLKLQVTLDRSVQVSPVATGDTRWPEWLIPIEADYWYVLGSFDRQTKDFQAQYAAGRFALEWLICSILIVLFLESRIDINEFSLHHFYKNRLVRCYLGATRGKDRKPSGLTGFDANDDFPIENLLAKRGRPVGGRKSVAPYYGPYPIVNGTVNLDQGSELAKQERKGESFVFTPLFCGFLPARSQKDDYAAKRSAALEANGYRSTWNYMYLRKGPDIGTCMGISGAAANPNWGYHTSAAVAFLLTVFDVRLGWWVGNPRRPGPSRKSGPPLALHPLISELLAQTDERAKYLNISDGGHFENLGVYELVRRRCRFIIAGDGEQDEKLTFESLGGAVRKCRIDFGVDIQIDPRRIQTKDGFSRTHCVVGKIMYPDAPQGWLLYLKASLMGDEPEDVTQYHSVHPDFPHETTADQFFTESQFESYRKLGRHILNAAFENVRFELRAPNGLNDLFSSLWGRWYPPSETPEGAASRNADAYSALLKRLCDDPDLAYLDSQIIRSANRPKQSDLPMGPRSERKAFYFCLELIQLTENVWSDLRLFNSVDRDNPRNGGWMDVFRYWANQEIFKSTWKEAGYTYNPLFQQFFTDLLKKPDKSAGEALK